MHLRILIPVLLAAASMPSCKKSDFLGAKPDQSLVVPSSLADCQAILDNDLVMNGYGKAGYPSLLENGTDDFYTTDAFYQQYTEEDQHAVTWAAGIYADSNTDDWNNGYRTILYANEVLDILPALKSSAPSPAAWNHVMGSALFYRAFAFYQLAQVFCPAYDKSSSASDAGIPLRLSADVGEKIFRATVRATYDRIVSDLQQALTLLEEDPGTYPTRPGKSAAYGLLARTYLCMYDYERSLSYADSCLQLRHELMDYNSHDTAAYLPFTRNNSEVIFAAAYMRSGPSAIKKSYTDSAIYNAYQPDDLRKTLFFKFGSFFFGRYDEAGYGFCGIAVDEMLLIRAESYARTGNVAAAMADINTLLTTRYTTGKFVPYTAADATDALGQILAERRKELLFRGLRWTDLRRLNKDNRWAVTLKRTVGNNSYTLPPNSPRYVYPIPANVIAANPGMEQNAR